MWLLTRMNQTRLPRETSLTLSPQLLEGSPRKLTKGTSMNSEKT